MIAIRRSALLSMDFQLDILRASQLAPSTEEGRARLDEAVIGAARALAWARRVGVSVVHVRHAFRPGYTDALPTVPMTRYVEEIGALIDGRPGTAIDERVAPVKDELVITKHTISALAATELDALLRSRGVDTLLLMGVVTHYVVEGTARHAADLGYRFVVLSDGCASGDPVRHAMALTNLGALGTVTTLGEIEAQSEVS